MSDAAQITFLPTQLVDPFQCRLGDELCSPPNAELSGVRCTRSLTTTMNTNALSAVSATNEDLLKLLLIILFGVGLLALGRWSSRLGAGTPDHPSNIPTPDASEAAPEYVAAPCTYAPGPEEVAASFPFDPSLGKIRITKFFFKKSDAIRRAMLFRLQRIHAFLPTSCTWSFMIQIPGTNGHNPTS